jgi:hypothetical protein
MLHVLLSESAFNQKSLTEVKEIGLEVQAEKNELIILKEYFDTERFKQIEIMLQIIEEFVEKYLEYARNYGIQVLEEKEVLKKMKNLKQEKEFIEETVSHFKQIYGNKVVPEIYKIGECLNKNVKSTLNRFYNLEKLSGMYLEDISKLIGYKKPISISEMLFDLGI